MDFHITRKNLVARLSKSRTAWAICGVLFLTPLATVASAAAPKTVAQQLDNALAQPVPIEGLAKFLIYGPIGLAGLMLVLVILALTARNIDPARERLLRQMMYVGAGCFAIATVANFFAVSGSYTLFLRVFPLDVGEKKKLPKPIVKANGKLLDENMTYLVKQDVTTIVDVSDAIDFVKDSFLTPQPAAGLHFEWAQIDVPDWAGRDLACSPQKKPVASIQGMALCDQQTVGNVAACWSGRKNGWPLDVPGAGECSGSADWCTYRSRTITTLDLPIPVPKVRRPTYYICVARQKEVDAFA